MLISLDKIIEKFSMHIRGVVHVGAHYGQELTAYNYHGIRDIVFIEPCKPAFAVLKGRIADDPHIVLFNCACGADDGQQEIYVETRNEGQSNSLLKPQKHLEYYPEIQFSDTETVPVRKLDNLPFDRPRYNLLMMDTQGAELLVLKGATETLRSIDYVYTEINDQELYEGNAMVSELDEFLVEFERVETYWVNNLGWGDAIYIRKNLLHQQS